MVKKIGTKAIENGAEPVWPSYGSGEIVVTGNYTEKPRRVAKNIEWDIEWSDVEEAFENSSEKVRRRFPIEQMSEDENLLYDFMRLPREVEIPNDLDDEDIADWLTDHFEFCHNGFELVRQ